MLFTRGKIKLKNKKNIITQRKDKMGKFTLDSEQEKDVQAMLGKNFYYLANEMGTGKTLTVLEYLRRTNQKALIVAPLLVSQRTWPQEIAKWDAFKDWSCEVIHGKNKIPAIKSDARIKIINYDGLKWLYYYLREKGTSFIEDRVLVLDEGSCFKTPYKGGNSKTVRFGVLTAIRKLFKAIYILSGTPMPNGYLDLWSQYFVLNAGESLYKTFGEFKNRYFYQSGPPMYISTLRGAWAAEVIQERISNCTSVRKAINDMPSITHRDVHVNLPMNARDKYKKLKETYVWMGDKEIWEVESAGVLVNKLRQLTQGGMYLKEEGGQYEKIHNAKCEALATLMESAEGDPLICAINFKFELDMINEYLGYKVPCIAGGMSLKDKTKILNDFSAKKIPLLLCHPASMSHGINDLQHVCNKVIWYSLPWSLEHYTQLNGRIIRRGQKRNVIIYHLVATNTIDTRISQVIKEKNVTQEQFKHALIEGALSKEN